MRDQIPTPGEIVAAFVEGCALLAFLAALWCWLPSLARLGGAL